MRRGGAYARCLSGWSRSFCDEPRTRTAFAQKLVSHPIAVVSGNRRRRCPAALLQDPPEGLAQRLLGPDEIDTQLARHLGATVFTTVGQRSVELVKRRGADVPIDYRSARFEAVAKDCDVVLDSAGGDTLVRCFECVKPGGVVVSIGSIPSAAFARSWGLNPIIVLAISLMSRKSTAAARRHNARYEHLFMRADGEQHREITQLVESGVIKPLVDKVFSLEQVRDALVYSESGRAMGKVVIKVA